MPEAEQARYAVRTPVSLWIVNGAVAALLLVVVAAMIMFPAGPPPTLVLLALALCSACVAFWFGMNAYRVGGGRNLIRFYGDRIEVPAVHERKPLLFTREGTAIVVQDVVVKYRMGLIAIGSVKRGKLIVIRRGAVTRKLSTLVLDDAGDEPALIADLQRFVAGEPAIGRAGHDVPAPRTDYDDRIDRELAQLE